MKIHEEILTTVRRLCIARRKWTFETAQVVRALPHLNEASVRTHIASLCCVNAPSNHGHRWPYFKRLRRGVYEVRPDYRESQSQRMKIHEEVLTVVRRLCATRGKWTFESAEVVHALPYLNEASVRTHIASLCCVNASSNRGHRWPYFKRVGRGVYEVLPDYREPRSHSGPGPAISSSRASEADAVYEPGPATVRSVIHAVVVESEGQYVADCLEAPVVTQGASLDELLGNIREALVLWMSDEDSVLLGLAPEPRLLISFETSAHSP